MTRTWQDERADVVADLRQQMQLSERAGDTSRWVTLGGAVDRIGRGAHEGASGTHERSQAEGSAAHRHQGAWNQVRQQYECECGATLTKANNRSGIIEWGVPGPPTTTGGDAPLACHICGPGAAGVEVNTREELDAHMREWHGGAPPEAQGGATPGPWALRGYQIRADAGRGAHVATYQINVADGQLLAAAPKLLSLLLDACDTLDAAERSSSSHSTADDIREQLSRLGVVPIAPRRPPGELTR